MPLGSLRSITLQNNNLGDNGAIILLRAFRKSGVLKRINLAENQLTDLSGKDLYLFLCSNK